MIYLRFAVVVCFLITGLFVKAQTTNTGQLVTNKGQLWAGIISYDTAKHIYTVITKDTAFNFAESEVRQITRNGNTTQIGQAKPGDYNYSAPPENPVYKMPYDAARFNNPDYVITKDGTSYKGWVIEDHLKEYVVMRMPDSTNKTIPYRNIRRVDYSNYTWAVFSRKKPKDLNNEVNLAKVHNLGLGLTVTGGSLAVIGAALIAGGAKNATTYQTGTSAGVRLTGAGALGAVLAVISIPIIIPGIIKLVQYKHYMAKHGNKAAINP